VKIGTDHPLVKLGLGEPFDGDHYK